MKARKNGYILGVLGALSILLIVGTANAQSFECDNNFGECGTPEESGGGGCGGGSILINNTDLGDTYQFADDYDDDGHEDPFDNCPFASNRDQADDDGDGVGTSCDNCPSGANDDQADIDGDLTGDVCDNDMDSDGIDNVEDICEANPDPLQKDADTDGLGDACDEDMDNDGVDNLTDNCPLMANPDQGDSDPDQFGDACDEDDDADGIRNTQDNCPTIANEFQEDEDSDALGDICDSDDDGDGKFDKVDNCGLIANPDQEDLDRDGLGEECDDQFCYVVYEDVENCLNPEDAFKVYSPSIRAEVGDEVMLHLFANRENEPMRYSWRIDKAPAGSNTSVENPKGAVNQSSPYEYRYIDEEKAILVPDQPGEYRVQLTAELVWEDTVTGETNVKAETYATIQVTGDAIGSGGCSVVPVGQSSNALVPLLLLGLGLFLRRR